MAPAWKTVRLIAAALVVGGAATALCGWVLVGCDADVLAQGLRAIGDASGGVVSLGT